MSFIARRRRSLLKMPNSQSSSGRSAGSLVGGRIRRRRRPPVARSPVPDVTSNARQRGLERVAVGREVAQNGQLCPTDAMATRSATLICLSTYVGGRLHGAIDLLGLHRAGVEQEDDQSPARRDPGGSEARAARPASAAAHLGSSVAPAFASPRSGAARSPRTGVVETARRQTVGGDFLEVEGREPAAPCPPPSPRSRSPSDP